MPTSDDIQIEVLFFAAAKEIVNAKNCSLMLSAGSKVADVRQSLLDRFPKLETILKQSRLAVNDTYAADDQTVESGDEIAVIPPVSGG